jgi:alpha-beta hydrolase superfamily lysophospholipase
MRSRDGALLPLKIWPAFDRLTQTGAPWGVVVALHGMNDYAEAFDLAGSYWGARGVTTYAYDQRGFGGTAHRGVWPGFGLLASDLEDACALARRRHPGAILAVAGESMGGAAAVVAFSGSSAPDADRLILLSPAVWGWSEQPLTSRAALWIADHLAPATLLSPPPWVFRRYPSSDNVEVLRRMGRDPQMIFRTRVDAAYGLVELMQQASERMGGLRLPTLYAYGARDTLIPRRAAERAAARLPAGARTAFYPEGWHLLNRDRHRQAVLEDALSFIRDPAAPLPSGAGPIPQPS